MSLSEQENEPNGRLFENWERVFRQIPGFETCLCLRRVRCPDKHGDMDFFLLNQNKPAFGLVECEGKTRRVPRGVEQLLTYVSAFLAYEGDGKKILEISVRDALESKKMRALVNARYGNVEGWIGQPDSCVKDEAGLVDLLCQASYRVVPILLYYREQPLSLDEQRTLSLAFRDRSLFAGVVHTAPWSVSGSYL